MCSPHPVVSSVDVSVFVNPVTAVHVRGLVAKSDPPLPVSCVYITSKLGGWLLSSCPIHRTPHSVLPLFSSKANVNSPP